MKSVILGAGTYGQVYLAYLRQAGVEVAGFLDAKEELRGKIIEGVPVLGNFDKLKTLKSDLGIEAVYCPIGSNKIRVDSLNYAKSLGYKTPKYIHPDVQISPNVEIGDGVYILLGTHIMPYAKIEDFCMISMGVNLAHHTLLKTGTFLSTGVNFGASICAEKYAYCGISSTIMTGIHRLGEDCLIGAGAVVIRDVPDKAVVAGVPAKVIKFKD